MSWRISAIVDQTTTKSRARNRNKWKQKILFRAWPFTTSRKRTNQHWNDFQRVLHILASHSIPARRRHRKGATIPDIEEVITLNRAALELCPPDYRYRAEILYSPVDNVEERFLKLGANADLIEAIARHRPASDLRLAGHSERSSSLYALVLCLWHWCIKQANMSDLEGAITLRRAVLELRPPGYCHRDLALYNLSLYLRRTFIELGPNAVLDKAIALFRSALNHRRAGHLDRSTSLNNLINRLRSRFKKLWAAAGLDGLISSPRAVLDLQPLGHPDHVMSLRRLLLHLQRWLRRLDIGKDLDECILLERAALALCVPASPAHVRSLCNSDLRKRFQKVGAITDLEEKITLSRTILDLHCLVMGAVHNTLESLPTRLLNTRTGVLCGRNALKSAFLNSQQYKRLLSSVTTCPTTLRDDIRNTVSTYFEYVTLSHRWDKDDPHLCHIQGRTIYTMNPTKGLPKLRAFCTAAHNCGYLWAWSDTCCVDRDDKRELTKSMASMFSWYRRSALTIVYLCDVSRDDTLSSSTWFKRGWTLQELLAPRKVLFYTQDWFLYKDSPSLNHKEDDAVLTELETTTGIERHYLTDFNPGFDNARSRLQWASGRQTTEPVDLAYSLFGIFNVDLRFRSGESVEVALGRLLKKIISESGDLSVLDWVGEASSFHSCFPAQIASYGTSPPTFHENEPQTSLPNTPEHVEAQVKLLRSLSTLEQPRFIGDQLRLPCIVYQVTTVELKAMNTIQTPKYVYNIQAEGLLPFEISLSHELKDTSRPILPFVLIRLWHAKPLPSSIEAGVSDELVTTLAQPSSALLLEEQSGKDYKRIASSSAIVARSADAASIFKGKPQTITVL